MRDPMDKTLPEIPAKRYFTIGEVSELCGVKAYVLRYWEQEFTQLRPVKRRGNRRYYQHHEVLLIRRIRELLYEEGFTISGARNRLTEMPLVIRSEDPELPQAPSGASGHDHDAAGLVLGTGAVHSDLWAYGVSVTGPRANGSGDGAGTASDPAISEPIDESTLRGELLTIRKLLEF